MPSFLFRASLLACMSLLVTGCGGSDRQATAPVSGVVTQGGEPLASVAVTFIPQSGGRSATGITDEQGRFTLTTYESNDGALVGEHRITVTPASQGEVSEVIPDDYDYETDGATTSVELPVKYADPNKSGLTQVVEAGKENQFELVIE